MNDLKKGFWLEDDPKWNELRDRMDRRPKAKIKPQNNYTRPKVSRTDKTEPKKLNLSLSLSLPNMPRISRKHLAFSLVPLGVIIVGIISYNLMSGRTNKANTGGNSGALSDTAQAPDFEIVLPNGKETETTSSNVGYDSKRKVASFTDRIGDIDITVSQQVLPENFKNDPDTKVQKLAQDFSATEVINESNPKAYLGSSVKGPQTVVFYKKDVLVFIFATGTIEKEDWTDYITRLQ